MPTYEYKCDKCGVFEYQQSITAQPLTECPKCKSPVQRLISSNVNIIFKGSGWHITDYRSSSYKKAAANDGTNGSCPNSAGCPAGGSCGAVSSKDD
jgi:putative FmdB family regulatory protein